MRVLIVVLCLLSSAAGAQVGTAPEQTAPFYLKSYPGVACATSPITVGPCPSVATIGDIGDTQGGVRLGFFNGGPFIGAFGGPTTNKQLSLAGTGNGGIGMQNDNGLIAAFGNNNVSGASSMPLFLASTGAGFMVFGTISSDPVTRLLFDMKGGATGGGEIQIANNSHVEYSGIVDGIGHVLPGLGSGAGDCGTSPSNVGNDNIGRVTVGSSTNGGKCTLTFSNVSGPWNNQPICQVWNETNPANVPKPVYTGVTAIAITGTLAAGDKLGYRCSGWF